MILVPRLRHRPQPLKSQIQEGALEVNAGAEAGCIMCPTKTSNWGGTSRCSNDLGRSLRTKTGSEKSSTKDPAGAVGVRLRLSKRGDQSPLAETDSESIHSEDGKARQEED
ncbi:hypothetical protein AYI68_g2611 [Smittium mucronatum]|uniref:Uncharacterized protein n=1 Tax=Smittium mucronatum TaxID=133383 RepID=A0A1R0H275_9FUNG|nr:hypothetical protein AYI68_g2611 [Smittium mucronatum]